MKQNIHWYEVLGMVRIWASNLVPYQGQSDTQRFRQQE